jgi:hypothetical protein
MTKCHGWGEQGKNPVGFIKPMPHAHRNLHPWLQAWVSTGTGVGCSGKPQDFPCHSLYNSVLLALAGILLQTGIDLWICHISGKDNIRVDLLSRLMIEEYFLCFPAEHVCLFSLP